MLVTVGTASAEHEPSEQESRRGLAVPRFRKRETDEEANQNGCAFVRVWVTGTSGSQESHLAHYGVRLAGFHGELKVGEVIEIQYRQKRARFRVVWIRSLDKSEKHLGAESIEPKKNIWTMEFADQTDEYEEKVGRGRWWRVFRKDRSAAQHSGVCRNPLAAGTADAGFYGRSIGRLHCAGTTQL